MWQALAALAGAVFTVAACYAAGVLLIARLRVADGLQRAEQLPLAFILGAACLHLVIFAILALHIAYWPVLVIVLAAVMAIAWRTGAWRLRTDTARSFDRLLVTLLTLCFAAYSILYFFNAWAPEASPDGSGYHLGFVARYLRARGFEPITTNLYAALSAGVEMLFVPAFAIGRHSAGALVHFSFAVALALAILAYGRRIGKPWAGAAASVLTFASPVVGRDATAAYVDVGVAAIAFAVFYWLEIWDADRNPRLLIPVGLLAGYAYAAKYTAFLIVVFAFGFVLVKARQVRPALLVLGCSAIMAVPWVIRNGVWYHNPIAPFGNAWFRNPYFHAFEEQDWTSWLRAYGLDNRWELPLEVTIRGFATNGILGPAFLLAPLALVSLRYAQGRRLLAAGFLLLSTYPANVGTRFLIPCVPFFSLALGLAFAEQRAILAALMLLHAGASWPSIVRRYAPQAWRIERVPWREALRIVPADIYLRKYHPDYGIARMIEDHVPGRLPVLAMSGAADSYTTHEIRVAFQSASNQSLADTINMGWNQGAQPVHARIFRLAGPLRRVRVLQTAEAEFPEQWSVHEVRFYLHGAELPRRPEWRLRAWPNPWDVQFAFDDSPVTRWRSGEVAHPGMYLDVDFGREEMVDEVRLETSPDYNRVRLQLETLDAAGRWQRIAAQPEDRVLRSPKSVRRAATYEMHLRGEDYLLIRSRDFGAEDFRQDPEGWGLKIVAEGYGATLYRTLW